MNHNIERLLRDRKARIELASKSHYWFFHLYLARYAKFPTADFQRQIFQATENTHVLWTVITAFRGSAKSTIVSLSYVLWAILGIKKKKFVLILSQTQSQAQSILVQIKREIESNEILRNDFGPLEYRSDEWGRDALTIWKYKTRIMAASTEMSVRGYRHGENRPDLIIIDDVENLQSVKTQEGRDKTYSWIMGDVAPGKNPDAEIFMIGTPLHPDSAIIRIKTEIEDGRRDGVCLRFPLLDDKGQSLWPGKYPDQAAIEKEKKSFADPATWQREFLLNPVLQSHPVIHREWIKFYDQLPSGEDDKHAIAIDPAIGEKSSNDFTAMISARIVGHGKDMLVYILPNIINERLSFPRQRALLRQLADRMGRPDIYIEDVGYQRAFIQEMKSLRYNAIPFHTRGQDKRSRLVTISHLIHEGRVLFPRHGAEQLINQLVDFGFDHDDLADALAILLHKASERNRYRARTWTHKPAPFF